MIDAQSSTHYRKSLPSLSTSTASSKAFGRDSPRRTSSAHSISAASLAITASSVSRHKSLQVHPQLLPPHRFTSVRRPRLSFREPPGLVRRPRRCFRRSPDLVRRPRSPRDLVVPFEHLAVLSEQPPPCPCPSLSSQGTLQLTLTLQVSRLLRQTYRPHTSHRKPFPPSQFSHSPSLQTHLSHLSSPRPSPTHTSLSRLLFCSGKPPSSGLALCKSSPLPVLFSPNTHLPTTHLRAPDDASSPVLPSSPPQRHHPSQHHFLSFVPPLTLTKSHHNDALPRPRELSTASLLLVRSFSRLFSPSSWLGS